MRFRTRYRLTEEQKICVLRGAKEQLDNFVSAEDPHSSKHAKYNVLKGFEPIVECKDMAKGVEGVQPSPVVISRDDLEYFIELLYFHEMEIEKQVYHELDAKNIVAEEADFLRRKELVKSREVIKRLIKL